MKPSDFQQLHSGFVVVAVIPGPLTVRVLEAQDVTYQTSPHRYFISVSCKFRLSDAMNIGKPGWLGCTKAEATREANKLAKSLFSAYESMVAAQDLVLNQDTFTNRFTLAMQSSRYKRIMEKYSTLLGNE